jgi:hypothetical protein
MGGIAGEVKGRNLNTNAKRFETSEPVRVTTSSQSFSPSDDTKLLFGE